MPRHRSAGGAGNALARGTSGPMKTFSDAQARALADEPCQPCQPAAVHEPKAAEPAAVVVADPSKPSWIVVEAVTADGGPAAGENYDIELPNGKHVTGALDKNGRIRVEGIDPGTCKVGFPKRDAQDWKKA